MSVRGKRFVNLVRNSPCSSDVQLAKLFDKINNETYNRAFAKAWSLCLRLREFSRRNAIRFDDEISEYKDQLSKLGWSGDYLQEMAIKLSASEINVVSYVKNELDKRRDEDKKLMEKNHGIKQETLFTKNNQDE